MPIAELRLGRYQDVMQDLENVDSVITDPPYSSRTHKGSVDSASSVAGGYISYDSFEEKDCEEFCRFWAPRVNNWIVILGDHWTSRWYEKYLTQFGLYTFAPVFYVKTNPMPRIQGDGPTSSGEWITRASTERNLVNMAADVLQSAEPRSFMFDECEGILTIARLRAKVKTPKSRPGHYLARIDQRNNFVAGQKDLDACINIVKDYSDPGDLVVDPFAGAGTFSRACQLTGRNSIACEVRPHIRYLAEQRLKEPQQLMIT